MGIKKIVLFLFTFITLSQFSLFNFANVTNAVTPVTIDKSSLLNAVKSQLNCGKIGTVCCQPLQLPSVRFGHVNWFLIQNMVNEVVDFLNDNVISVFDKVITDTGTFIEDKLRGNTVCGEGQPSDLLNLNNCKCLPLKNFNIALLCVNIANLSERTQCINCSKRGIWTGLGCVDFNFQSFITNTLFGVGIGLAGVISLLCIIYSAFMLQTSRGNPERIKKSQELLTSCIMGLMLIIFSIFILKLIGVNILRIPGFS